MDIFRASCCVITLLVFTFSGGSSASAAYITGSVVTDHGGSGIEGSVEVRSGDPCNDKDSKTVTRVEVDATAESRFSTLDLPAGIYYLVGTIEMAGPATVPEYWAGEKSSPHCSEAVQMNILENDVLTDINFELDTGAELSGSFYDKKGKQVEGDVSLYEGDACGEGEQYDTDGSKFVIGRIAKGTYYLASQPKGNYLREFWAGDSTTFDCKEAKPVVVGKAEIKKGLDFHLSMVEGAKISGEVTDVVIQEYPISYWVNAYTGNPCSQPELAQGSRQEVGAGVNYEIAGLPAGEYYFKAEGRFDLDIAGEYATKWWTKNGGSVDCKQAEPVAIATGEEIVGIDFQLERGSIIEGDIFDSSGEYLSVEDTTTLVVYLGNPCKGGSLFDEAAVSLIPDENNYWVSGLPAGTYYLLSKKLGYRDQWWTSSEGTSDCQLAEPITIGVSETLSGKDFYLEKNRIISSFINELLLKSSK